MGKWTRRAFIGAGTLLGGGFVLGAGGFALAPSRHSVRPDSEAAGGLPGQLTTWILVTPDNLVTVLVPQCEMGQGAQTALAMMAAEEMNADWDLVRVREAPALPAYANAYIGRAFLGDRLPSFLERGFDYGTYRLAAWYGTQATGGSTSIRGTGVYGMTSAGAAAREMLVAAAAARWSVDPSSCTAANSRVAHPATGRSASFGELADAAAQRAIPSSPVLKDPASFTIRRTPRPRFDIPSKVNGSAIYAIDYTMPGMLSAAVALAPAAGGRLISVDSGPAEAMPGVRQVVRLEQAVAVVADTYWHARRALAALTPVFDDNGNGTVSTSSIFAAFEAALGVPPALPAPPATLVTADYRVPFLAHATMEPMVCTVRVENDRVDIWSGVQDPLNARSTAAAALDIEVEQVHVNNLQLGGGFGRRLPGYLDYVGLAAQIARPLSPAPVKVVWSRENDIQRDFYRPAGMMRFSGGLDASGAPTAIRAVYAGGGDSESVFMPYSIDHKAEAREAAHPVRTGPWRSVLNSQHGFFKESFIDELAHAAKQDPYQFRRDLCAAQPRFRVLLEKVAAMSGWGTPLPEGEGRGIAIAESFGSIVAHVAHVRVSPEGTLRVLRIHSAVDCGDVVNPDTATAQVQGGIVFGLSAALLGEITIAEGRVVQRNFNDHQMIRIKDVPEIVVEFVRSTAAIGGLGEPVVPPVAPAVANAIFAARGVRVRALPIKNTSLRAEPART